MSYRSFTNKECEFFPCHHGVDDERGKEYSGEYNCLFCFCPLYHMEGCGGKYHILPNGTKDCSECMIPHIPDNYDYIIRKL